MCLVAILSACVLQTSQPDTAIAEPTRDAAHLGWVSVELDPTSTALGARNLLLYIEPSTARHWSGSAIVFSSDFPGWITNVLSYRNRDADFDMDVRISPGITIDYFLAATRTRWHVGAMSFLWRYEVERGGDVARFVNHVILPRIGYRWFPFRTSRFYLDPFAGLMTEYRLSGDRTVDGTTVKTTPLVPFATVHLGYHF